MATRKVYFELELPDELIASFKSQDMANREALEAFVTDLVRQGRLSQGRAAKLLGVSRWDLPKVLSKHEVPAITMTPEELESDWTALQKALRET